MIEPYTCIECEYEAYPSEEDVTQWLDTGQGPVCPGCWSDFEDILVVEPEDLEPEELPN